MNITLSIDGMHCASCAQAIEKQLKKHPKVQNAAVNLVNETVYIDCDEDERIEHLIAAIGKAGYQAYEDEDA